MTETTTRSLSILLVEDDDDHAQLVQIALRSCNDQSTLHRACDGVQALEYLGGVDGRPAATVPDLILLDLNLPKLNGHDVLRIIKNDERLKAIPVVILTTSANATDRALAYSLHANSFLSKPVEFKKFQQMIRDLNNYWTQWNLPPAM